LRSAEPRAPFEILPRVQVQFALKEIDRTNTHGVSLEDSARSPIAGHGKQIGKKDGGKHCRNSESTAIARGCNRMLG
jgi:hypothetical protein